MTENTQTKLTVSLPSDTEIFMERTFNAPRELVWRAYTDASHIANWWGQRANTTIIDKMDVKPGGLWRYIERDPEGNEYGFNGTYKEVTPIERLSYTFEFEGTPGHICTDNITFEDLGSQTKLKIITTFDNKEDRDGLLQSGMEIGANESYDRLEELLTEWQK
jgi:uncharacterized protein YndB with AHSA1/START domain